MTKMFLAEIIIIIIIKTLIVYDFGSMQFCFDFVS